MVEVVVVGGGLAGLATAARLAKAKHTVTVVERSDRLGGALNTVEEAGHSWPIDPSPVTLPAVLRDLFRKSGRPLESYVGLSLRPVARRHVFADGSVVDLPTGSRAAQLSSVEAGLGRAAAVSWCAFVDAQADRWDTWRREVLDRPDGGSRLSDRAIRGALAASTSLATALARSLADDRLRVMAAHTATSAGSDPRDVSSIAAVDPYVERSFGVWDVEGGPPALAAALATRMEERRVRVLLGRAVRSIEVGAGRVRGVRTADGELIGADVVVSCVDPRQALGALLPSGAARRAQRAYAAATPALPPWSTHLGLRGPLPDLPPEVVFHGDPTLVVTRSGTAPAGGEAWTVQGRGGSGEDALAVLARRGLDLRDRVVVRVDQSPADVVGLLGGSPFGLVADGWRAQVRRAGLLEPMPGLLLAGAGTHPGAGLPYTAWRAAHVAEVVGRG